MSTIVRKVGLVYDVKFLYYVDRDGDIARVPMGSWSVEGEKVVKLGIKKQKGWLYYINKNGDVEKARFKSRMR